MRILQSHVLVPLAEVRARLHRLRTINSRVTVQFPMRRVGIVVAADVVVAICTRVDERVLNVGEACRLRIVRRSRQARLRVEVERAVAAALLCVVADADVGRISAGLAGLGRHLARARVELIAAEA